MAEKKRRGEKLLDARKMGAIMEKNFTVLRRDMTRMVPLILFPIFMILIFGFTSGNIPKHISTGVIVYDNSPFSQEIQQAIASNEVFSVTHVVSTEGEGRRLLDEGKVHILIEIPQDLQKNLDAGKQASITVIVDESDSSIAAAAHQTLSALIDGIANSLAQKRFAAYQQSVASSSQSLQSYITSQPNAYDAIASHTTVAQNLLVQSYALTDEYAMALHSSLPNPGLVVLSNDFQNPSNTSTQNNIIISEGGSGSAIRAQIALMQKASSLTLSGKEHVQAANSLALQAGERLSNLQEYSAYEKQVSQPLQEIRVFTQSKADNTLTPIVYAEKAAYGTGKRPVDFVIPIIIAITIFQGAVMGMGRAVAGEKREGALTRVFLTPTSNATIIIGTLCSIFSLNCFVLPSLLPLQCSFSIFRSREAFFLWQ